MVEQDNNVSLEDLFSSFSKREQHHMIMDTREFIIRVFERSKKHELAVIEVTMPGLAPESYTQMCVRTFIRVNTNDPMRLGIEIISRWINDENRRNILELYTDRFKYVVHEFIEETKLTTNPNTGELYVDFQKFLIQHTVELMNRDKIGYDREITPHVVDGETLHILSDKAITNNLHNRAFLGTLS